MEKEDTQSSCTVQSDEAQLKDENSNNQIIGPASANSSAKSSPVIQRKGSDNELKFGNVGQALMSSSVLSSTLAIPNQTVSACTSPASSREPSVEISLQRSSSKDTFDVDSLGSLPQSIPSNDQRDVGGSQDNVSRSSESGRSFDGSSFGAPRSSDTRLDAEKVCGRSSSGETKGTLSSTGKSSEKKKKSTAWYNVLNPTYKSRSDDFKKIFKDLPESERLIVDYSCAMQKDLIVHGRLYLSQNYICFYANIFRWETTVVLKCKDVTSMTKEKTARVIPNAIQICTDTEKYFLTSFGARDKTYLMLFRVWQNALLEQPMTIQELWQWVHYSYGEELGLTSDDDDYVAPLDDKNDCITDSCSIIPDDDKHQSRIVADDEDEVDSYKPGDDSSVFSELNSHLLADGNSKDPSHVDVESVSKRSGKLQNLENLKVGDDPTDISDTTDSNEPEAEIPCPCSGHEGKEIKNELFSFSVDQMFSLLFGGSKFLMNLLDCRKIYDIQQSTWQDKAEQPNKIRQLTYIVSLNNPMSPKTAPTTETQTLVENKPEQLYIVRSDVVSTGIPYSDSFSCFTNYCITKVNSKKCRVKVHVGVSYRKSVFGLVKGFIEKNAIANMCDYFNDLTVALHREAGSHNDKVKPKKSRRRRRIKIGETKSEFVPETIHTTHTHASIRKTGSMGTTQVDGSLTSTPDSFMKMVFGVLLLLLFLNVMLFYKIWILEEQTELLTAFPSQGFLNVKNFRSSFDNGQMPQTNDEWMALLLKQETLNNLEREKWKSLVSDIIKLIQTTETSLSHLFDNIQNSYHKVPADPAATATTVNRKLYEKQS